MSLLALAAAAAIAAPAPCTGAPAKPGAVVSGAVLQVIDAQRLCIAGGPTPDQWTEVRLNTVYVHALSDRDPAYGKAALMSVAFARRLDCAIGADGKADCKADGQALSDLVSAPGAGLRAAAWMRPAKAPDFAVMRVAAR